MFTAWGIGWERMSLSWYHAALGVYKDQMWYVDTEGKKGGCKYLINRYDVRAQLHKLPFWDLGTKSSRVLLQGSMYTPALYSHMQLA